MYGENKIFGVIRDCHKSLSWLQSEEGIEEKKAPEEHRDNLKQLEKLGIIYKRNGRSLGIRWERIRRLIERSARGSAVPNNPQEMLDYFTVASSSPATVASSSPAAVASSSAAAVASSSAAINN